MGKFKSIAFANEDIIEVEPLAYFPNKTHLVKSHYVHNGAPALLGVHTETRELLWTATVQIPDNEPPEGCVWIRSNGVYVGMLEALARVHVIEFTGHFAKIPGTSDQYAFECKLLM